jgi:phosphoglycerate dehydrogenase-like enzyme
VSQPLVWLPFEPSALGEVPAGLRYEVVETTASAPEPPASIAEVEFFVPSYMGSGGVGALLPRMSALKVVQTLTAGVDNVRGSVPDGVLLCNGRGIHDTSTAELALTLTLGALRGLPRFVTQQTRGEWRGGMEQSLADKRALIVGYGAVGRAIETRLLPFECEVVRVARTARPDDDVHALADLPALLPEADVVILVVPLTAESRGMVEAGFLAAMRPGALLVNLARGPVVDTDAVLAALDEGRIRYAADVTDPEPLPADHPLWHAPGALITPHVGGHSTAMWPRAHRLVREQLARFAAGEPLANVITGEY